MLPVNNSHFSASESLKRLVKLTPKRLRILETAATLSPGDKVHLLLMLAGRKWISEVAIGITDTKEIEEVLGKLGLPYSHDKIEGYEKWITVGANRAVLKYIHERREELSEIEAGVLYGYPVTHTFGFAGILKSKLRKGRTIERFYLGGVYSDAYFNEEKAYFDELWGIVCETSPLIRKEAEEYFQTVLLSGN